MSLNSNFYFIYLYIYIYISGADFYIKHDTRERKSFTRKYLVYTKSFSNTFIENINTQRL